MTIRSATRQLALKNMGEALLAVELTDRFSRLEGADMVRLENAIALAALAHQGQTRANRGPLPRDTYLTHPLRNALRLMRYGVTDQDVIIATVLHDVVEDAAEYVVNHVAVWTIMRMDQPEKEYRRQALRFIDFEFGSEVARLVKAVTNPLPVPGVKLSKVEKRMEYAKHVIMAIEDPKVAVVKLTDFVDNAVGLYHNTGMSDGARDHLARKYFSLIEVFVNRVYRSDVRRLLSEAGAERALQHLVRGSDELAAILQKESV